MVFLFIVSLLMVCGVGEGGNVSCDHISNNSTLNFVLAIDGRHSLVVVFSLLLVTSQS